MTKQRCHACVFACILSAIAYASADAQLPGWDPYLDQPIRQLEELLETLEQQQPMNFTLADICILYDAKLYILFDHCLDTLEPDAREAAEVDQARWLEARSDSVSLAGSEYEGGTLGPFAAGMRFIEVTKRRIVLLEEAMQECEPR